MKTIIFFCLVTTFWAIDYSALSAPTTIQSGFFFERYLSAGKKPIVSRGKFYFERPSFFRWEWLEPAQQGLLIDNDAIAKWRITNDKKEIADISSDPSAKILAEQLLLFISMDIDKIRITYDVQESGNVISLTPIQESTIKEVILACNTDCSALTQLEMHAIDGGKTIIRFFNTQFDQSIPNSAKTP
ncbi:hypothetical protein FACS189487_03700 [Campylobacterota bacterium]|nr:hypothetical protein FACS189487_03700 [Campylobacterota bacterium]